MKIVYVAGKYTGENFNDTEKNIQKAREVAIQLWAKGYFVLCPHLNTAHFETEPLLKDFGRARYIEADLWFLSFCDAVVLVDNWVQSLGAKQERAYAEAHGIPVFNSVEELGAYRWMSPEQERHLFEIKRTLCRTVDEKYRLGQREHGGDLWLKDQIKNITPEITDLSVYWFTFLYQLTHGIITLKGTDFKKDKDEQEGLCL